MDWYVREQLPKSQCRQGRIIMYICIMFIWDLVSTGGTGFNACEGYVYEEGIREGSWENKKEPID